MIDVLASGHFDPLHSSHIKYIQASAKFGDLTVIVNGDCATFNKKGYVFMPCSHRLKIIKAIKGVKEVVEWDHRFVDKAILKLKPKIFTNGGDKSNSSHCAQCEIDACHQVGCRIEYGVGGTEKTISSSELCKNLVLNFPHSQQDINSLSPKEFRRLVNKIRRVWVDACMFPNDRMLLISYFERTL